MFSYFVHIKCCLNCYKIILYYDLVKAKYKNYRNYLSALVFKVKINQSTYILLTICFNLYKICLKIKNSFTIMQVTYTKYINLKV